VPANATADLIRASWNGQTGWRWMFYAVLVPSVVFFASAWLIPESPRWLAQANQDERARRTLARIGGEAYGADSLKNIHATVAQEAHSETLFGELLTPRMFSLLATGVVLAVLQQWAGINVIFNYAEEIYRSAGYGLNGVLFNITVTGAVNLIFTLVALALVDHLGRRTLMLWGCAGLALSHAVLGVAYATGTTGLAVLVLTLCAIGCFALSLGPVTWVLIAEIFPNRIRGAAVSVAVSALWIASFVVTFTFPLLNRLVGPAGTFWTYSAICVAGLAVIVYRVPETKGRTLEQIELDWKTVGSPEAGHS
jgi:SP family xylose:H+ symportor-like MFS transporter